jgi:hypothetical protein
VARDLERKLQPGDRLLGAYRLAVTEGLAGRYLSVAVAAAGALLLTGPGRSRQGLPEQLQTGLDDVLDERRRSLLERQVTAFLDGLDTAGQLTLIDNEFEPSRVA